MPALCSETKSGFRKYAEHGSCQLCGIVLALDVSWDGIDLQYCLLVKFVIVFVEYNAKITVIVAGICCFYSCILMFIT